MSKGRFEKKGHRRSFSSKSLALMMACVLLLGCFVGGTVAWLTAQTSEVRNTFSTSDIGVELEETTTEYKMVPGWDITKDPKAWVTEGSEAAYLFVKVEKSANFDSFMTYEIADGWTKLTSVDDGYEVYYREVTTEQMGKNHASAILKDDKVTVRNTVTKEMMSDEGFTKPTLTFTAYAHQLYKSETPEKFDAATAWSNLNPNE